MSAPLDPLAAAYTTALDLAALLRTAVDERPPAPPTGYAEAAEILATLRVRVRHERIRRGLGLRDVAREINGATSTVSRFENGKDVSVENAIALLRWLAREAPSA